VKIRNGIQTFLHQHVIIYFVNEIYADIFLLSTSLPTVSHNPKICVPNKKEEMIEEIPFFIPFLLFFSSFFLLITYNFLQKYPSYHFNQARIFLGKFVLINC